MEKARSLKLISDAELFGELTSRHHLQAAFALFARLTNQLSSHLDLELNESDSAILKADGQQAATMWQSSRDPSTSSSAQAAEVQLFRNLMESHIVELSARSARHRDYFTHIIGGSLDSLQYVRSDSATRWIVGQLCPPDHE